MAGPAANPNRAGPVDVAGLRQTGTVTSHVELLARACAGTGGVLATVTSEQLADPTPCDGWLVHDLIDHIVGAADFFADIAERGSSAEGREWPSYSSADFIATFGQQASRVVAAFTAPGAMERIMLLSLIHI